jgi:hypothetical protein
MIEENLHSLPHGDALRLLIEAQLNGRGDIVEEWLLSATKWQRRMFKSVRDLDKGQLLISLGMLTQLVAMWSNVRFGQWEPSLSTHLYEVNIWQCSCANALNND